MKWLGEWVCKVLVERLLVIISIALITQPALADVLLLKGGDRLSGSVTKMDNKVVVIRTEYAGELTFAKADVAGIEFAVEQQSGHSSVGVRMSDLGEAENAKDDGLPHVRVMDSTLGSTEDVRDAVHERTRRLSHRSALLTPPDNADVSIGLHYTSDHMLGRSVRSTSAVASVQYGVWEGIDASVSIPVRLVDRRTDEEDKQESGFGNFDAGLRYLMHAENADWPEIVAGLSLSAPNDSGSGVADPFDTSLDAPYWSASADLSILRSYDPIVLYGLVGYQYARPYKAGGETIDPGDAVYLGAGIGFAANSQVSLNGQFLWSYRHPHHYASLRSGTSQETAMVRVGTSVGLGSDSAVSASVGFGLTDDASDASVSVSYTKRF